jgi:hypothetical protein
MRGIQHAGWGGLSELRKAADAAEPREAALRSRSSGLQLMDSVCAPAFSWA